MLDAAVETLSDRQRLFNLFNGRFRAHTRSSDGYDLRNYTVTSFCFVFFLPFASTDRAQSINRIENQIDHRKNILGAHRTDGQRRAGRDAMGPSVCHLGFNDPRYKHVRLGNVRRIFEG